MIATLRSQDRGSSSLGWLDSAHSFSFAGYMDPARMGFGPLRVINEDRVAPGAGFGAHSHRDMEIISYVIDGALEHRDNMGNGSVLRPGDIQRMSAGTGVTHSEFNHSRTEPVHFLQIWITPAERDLEPGYQEAHFPLQERVNRWQVLVAGKGGGDGILQINQDAMILGAFLRDDGNLEYRLSPGRRAWVQLVHGSVVLNGISLRAGDGAAIQDERLITLSAADNAELLLFDLP